MAQTHLLSVLILLPLVGSLAILLLGRNDHEWVRRLALATSLAEFLISLFLLRGFDMRTAGYQFEEFHRWISSPPIHYHLGIDGISLFLVLLATFLTPFGVLCS